MWGISIGFFLPCKGGIEINNNCYKDIPAGRYRRRHSSFDDNWDRPYVKQQDSGIEPDVMVLDDGTVFQFSSEGSSRSDKEGPDPDAKYTRSDDDDEISIYDDALSRKTSFVSTQHSELVAMG